MFFLGPENWCLLVHTNGLLSQRTWTFWRECPWSTRRCPAGAAAPRLHGASRSCQLRPRSTSASSRTSCKYQVGWRVLGVQTEVQMLVLPLKPPNASCPFWFQWNGSESANPGRAWSSCFDPPAEFQVFVSLNFIYFTSRAVWTRRFSFRFTFIPQRSRLYGIHLLQLCINVLSK